MPSKINLQALADAPLMLRQSAPGDYAVMAGGLAAGRIMCKPVAGSSSVWFWTITGPYIAPELQPSSGDCASLYEAKAAFCAKFDAWLAWAGNHKDAALWHA